jgi:hypothetical protein
MIIRDVRLAERRSDCGWEVSDDPSATRQGTVFSWGVGEFGVPVMPSRVSVPKGRSVEDCLGGSGRAVVVGVGAGRFPDVVRHCWV